MSSGPDNVTTTSRSEVPGFLKGPLTTAVNAAEQQFNAATGNQFSSGPRFSGGPLAGTRAGRINPRLDGFNVPTQNNAVGLTQQTPAQSPADADFGLPGTGFNPLPFLTNQFQRAAQLTRGQLDTEFSGAGRNLGAAIPARSAQLQDLSNQFFDPSNLFEFDPTNVLINRLSAIIPNAGGTTTSTQPVFKQGLFGF